MAIGRISGPMLFPNLERQGVDLAFQSNLLYLDVNNLHVGVINDSPQYPLDVNGNVKLSNIIIQNSTFSSNTGVMYFGSNANVNITGGSLNAVLFTDGEGNLSWGTIDSIINTFGNIQLKDNTIQIINTDGNLNLQANGTGNVVTTNDFYAGNIYALNIVGTVSSNGGSFSGNVVAPNFEGNLTAGNITANAITTIDGNANTWTTGNLNSTNGNITTLVTENFSTGNAWITGGDIRNVNVQANNFSTANALITGGYIYGLANITSITGNVESWYSAILNATYGNIITLYVTNFSTGNAIIYGGAINNTIIGNSVPSSASFTTANTTANLVVGGNAIITSTLYAEGGITAGTGTGGNISGVNYLLTSNVIATGNVTAAWLIGNIAGANSSFANLVSENFNTGNALITGGNISGVTDLSATSGNIGTLTVVDLNATNGNISTLFAGNFSTANAVITGGDIRNVNIQANNFSTANAYLGNIWIYDQTITGLNLDQDIIIAPKGSGSINTNNAIIINVGEPLSSQDAATKNYVDSQLSSALFSVIGDDDSTVSVIDNGVDPGNVIITVDGVDVAWFTAANTQIANVLITGNTISSTSANLVISANLANPNNVVIFDSVSAFNIPTGNTEQRPADPASGYVRFNTDTHTVEWWAVDRWIAGAQTIVQQTITPDGFNNSFTLIQETTAESILVNINGTVQQPYTAYNVIGGVLLQLSEVPEITDIIEVRFLNTGIAKTTYTGGNVEGAVHILDTTSSISSNTGALVVEGGVGIVGNLSLDGRVYGNLIPGVDAFYSIGSSALRWQDLYTAGTTYHSGHVYVYDDITATGDVSGATLTGTLATGIQPAITTVGTITSGTWNGGTLGIAYGGTGATSQSGALNNLLPSGELAGYVLTTGGAGSYYWAAGGGGGGGGGGTLSGIFNQSTRTYYVATSGQTTFSTESNFTPGTSQLRVYQNGVRQFESEYTETNGNTFVLSTACAAGDLILAEIDGYNSLTVFANVSVYEPSGGITASANTVQLAIDNLESRKVNRSGDTMTGALIITDTTKATSITTGALKVKGGLSVEAGNVYIGGSNGNAIIATGNIYGTRVFSMGSNVLIPSSNVATQVSSLGVGTTPSGVAGEIRATNDIIAYYSDDRLKTRLGQIDNALDKIKSLTGFYYQANDIAQSLGYPVKREIGVSAQDVQKVLPEIIAEAPIDSNYMTLKYEKIIPVLIEAIKELSAQIDDLRGKL
jgi:hypothetical protein